MIDYGHHHPQKSTNNEQPKNVPGQVRPGQRYPGGERGSTPSSAATSQIGLTGQQPFSAASLTTTTSVTSSSTAHGMPFHSTASYQDSAGLVRPSQAQPTVSTGMGGMSSAGISGNKSAGPPAVAGAGLSGVAGAGLSGLAGAGVAGVAGAAALLGSLQQPGLSTASSLPIANPLALLGGAQMFQSGGLLGATTPAVENPALALQNILAQQQSQPKSAANFSNEDLKKLLGTLKEIERQVKQKEQAKQADPFQQLALAAQLQALSAGPAARPTSEQQVAAVAKTIPLTQQEALKKLSNVMNEQDMSKLMTALKDIEKKAPAVPQKTEPKAPNEAQMQHGQRVQPVAKQVEMTRARAKQSRFSPIDDASKLKKNPSPPRSTGAQIPVLNTRGPQLKSTTGPQLKTVSTDDTVLNQAPWQTTKPPPWANKEGSKPSSEISVTSYAKQMAAKQIATKPAPSSAKPEVCICVFPMLKI